MGTVLAEQYDLRHAATQLERVGYTDLRERLDAAPSAVAIFVFLHSRVMCLLICPPTARCQVDKACFSTALLPTTARFLSAAASTAPQNTSPEPSAANHPALGTGAHQSWQPCSLQPGVHPRVGSKS
jgi:hypothetical protein